MVRGYRKEAIAVPGIETIDNDAFAVSATTTAAFATALPTEQQVADLLASNPNVRRNFGLHGESDVWGYLAMLVGVAAVIAAGLAFVPIVGYVEAVVLPLFGLRTRQREPERHAGLRTLARD